MDARSNKPDVYVDLRNSEQSTMSSSHQSIRRDTGNLLTWVSSGTKTREYYVCIWCKYTIGKIVKYNNYLELFLCFVYPRTQNVQTRYKTRIVQLFIVSTITYIHMIAAFVSCLSKGLQLCLFQELSIINLKVNESENRFQNRVPLETHFLVFESLNVDSTGF